MSAIPSACQPSKKSGSISTQRRYFSTASSSSPIARSPLASSNILSRVCSIDIFERGQHDRLYTSAFGKLHISRALPGAQPLVEHNLLFAFQVLPVKRYLALLIFCQLGQFAFFQQNNQA